MDAPGDQIRRARSTRELSQADLARLAQVSQATISRLEAASEPPSDIRVLARVAKVLGLDLADLLDGTPLDVAPADEFWAFCPNPLCDRNKTGVTADTGAPWLQFASSKRYLAQSWSDVNFCGRCGTEL